MVFFGVLLVVSLMEWVDGHNFRPGAPNTSIFKADDTLYQTQLDDFLLLAPVPVGLLAICCTAPLVWIVILVQLENRGKTLSKISHLNGYNVPILPKYESERVVVVVWISNFGGSNAMTILGEVSGRFVRLNGKQIAF